MWKEMLEHGEFRTFSILLELSTTTMTNMTCLFSDNNRDLKIGKNIPNYFRISMLGCEAQYHQG